MIKEKLGKILAHLAGIERKLARARMLNDKIELAMQIQILALEAKILKRELIELTKQIKKEEK